MLVARRRCRLNEKNVAATNILLDHHVRLAIGERANRGLAKRDADIFANALGQLAIGGAAKDLHFWLKCEHEGLNSACEVNIGNEHLARKELFRAWYQPQ